jgi:hypothetical protein
LASFVPSRLICPGCHALRSDRGDNRAAVRDKVGSDQFARDISPGANKPLVNPAESLFYTGERVLKYCNPWAIGPLTRRSAVAIGFLVACGSRRHRIGNIELERMHHAAADCFH